MKHFHIQTRRDFFSTAMKMGTVAALSSLTDIPLVMKKALAANASLGQNGKKLLFIFLRGANDALNSVIPINDVGYAPSRPTLAIQKDPALGDYTAAGACDLSAFNTDGAAATFGYTSGIRLGNGFAALHPSLKFLAPVYNAGDLALIHRVGYPRQSRSHFDSQNYWETGSPNDNMTKDGIFYRTVIESGLAHTAPLTAVSIQSSLPLLLRGSQAALTNLDDPSRFNLMGIPNDTAGNNKADAAMRAANLFPYPNKLNRDLLSLQYKNLSNTLQIFADLQPQFAANYMDNENLDGEAAPYNLFPSSNATNGGYAMHANNAAKYVVSTGSYTFFQRLKNAAIVLNKTDAIISGTQLDGFDTHSAQGALNGAHPNLQRSIAWAMYALKKYYTINADKVSWDNLVVITLSEFGRTTVENSDLGTDHAEAGVMFVAGGNVKGYTATRSGVYGCSPNDPIKWEPGTTPNVSSMYGASQRYLKRAYDYRQVLGKLIRGHLAATPEQLYRIIPGYDPDVENLAAGGMSGIDRVTIMPEPDII